MQGFSCNSAIPMFDRIAIDPAVPIISICRRTRTAAIKGGAMPVRPCGARTRNGREHGGPRRAAGRQIACQRSANRWTW